MAASNRSTRRALLGTLASLPVVAAAAEKPPTAGGTGGRVLVVYFSRTGNTRVIAGLIQRSLKAQLAEIVPATPYPEDYLETVEQARQERDAGRTRPMARRIDVAAFDTVYLGFPMWGETVPPVVRAFLASQNWQGKTLVPFQTHGGYGLGNSQEVLRGYLTKGQLQPGFVMEADQERRTMTQVGDWLKDRRSGS
ncbi:flavodoxin [Comamonas piscis]|uniref:Flavodoxin n=1 Tax=Comamonas piscis TaxID=1562974 RepID=A0A7G5EFS6_9BURK|nr:flavodoxin [Comamonas piscis]QMV72851.1 flavodoxin [Comamonas piscis]WSO35628.1 flavodoxin [Comamonas piscis]